MKENRAARRAARFHRSAISLSVEGEALPTEFRLFQAGWNETEKGNFLFDDKAAKSVMASFEKWGIDRPIDLEHQMLDVEGGAPDPTARDARGWCRLELRNGELWACDVRWTPDGAERLRDKRQRYVSPAFESDPKTGRILKIINVAITALPATHKTPALVAATAREDEAVKNEHAKAALDALEKGDHEAASKLLKAMLAEDATDEDTGESDGAEGVAPPKTEKEDAIDPKVVDESDGDDEEEEPKKKVEQKAMSVLLCTLAGKSTLAEAMAEVETWRASHVSLAAEKKQIADARASLERDERVSLCAQLVKLGAEFPATVYVDTLAKSKKLKARWANMPIDELRSHVSEQRTARGGKDKPAVQPPPGEGSKDGEKKIEVAGGFVTLSANELQICNDMGTKPEDYAALKAQRDGVQKG